MGIALMKSRIAVVMLLSLLFVGVGFGYDEALTANQIEQLRDSFEMDGHTRAVYNALTGTNINSMVLNRDIVKEHNNHFSNVTKVKGISNQKSSGRCWLFATLNVMRPSVINDNDLGKFEFSQNYLTFWDKLEKANMFLQRIIDWRGRDMMDRELVFILKDPIPDGGYWENGRDLLARYGAVPSDIMPETNSSNSTKAMNKTLKHILRSDAAKLRRMDSNGKNVAKLQAAKEEMLADIYKILVVNLGEPPKEFVWRYETKGKDSKDEDGDEDEDEDADDEDDEDETTENKKLVVTKLYTPQSFFADFADVDLDEYVNIFNDTIHPYGKRYNIVLTRNFYDGNDIDYVNVDIETLKQIAMASLIDGTPLQFAADVSVDMERDKGIMADGVYDYESIYGISFDFSKADRAMFRNSTRNHGMLFVGVDVKDGKPLKWKVENSWGSDKGNSGYWSMYSNWFDMNVYNIVVKKKYVPAEVLKIYEQKPTTLPVWDPMW